MPSLVLSLVNLDVADAPVDLLVMKYAQERYGSDKAIADKLIKAGVAAAAIAPEPGELALIDRAVPGIRASAVAFIGTPPLYDFGYDDVEALGFAAVNAAARALPQARRLGLTLHGPGFGLDELECCRALATGLLRGARLLASPFFQEAMIIERNKDRSMLLWGMLDAFLPSIGNAVRLSQGKWQISFDPLEEKKIVAPAASVRQQEKSEDRFGDAPHVFVAMPFAKEFNNVYYFGIQAPIRDEGLLCERIDQSSFVGAIFEHVKKKIETARLVVADLTGSNANVYLEVGYAWGRGVPTLLLSQDVNALKFDARDQRCLEYDAADLQSLNQRLRGEIKGILRQ